MKRVLACIVVLGVIGFGLFLPGLIPTDANPAGTAFEPTRITSYDADFTLADER